MLINHTFMGAKMKLVVPPGGTVMLFGRDEIEVLRKILELLVELNGEAEGPVAEVWAQLNQEESQQ